MQKLLGTTRERQSKILAFQYIAAAEFLVVGLSHLVIWIRGREYGVHLLFALTVLCAAGTGALSSHDPNRLMR